MCISNELYRDIILFYAYGKPSRQFNVLKYHNRKNVNK